MRAFRQVNKVTSIVTIGRLAPAALSGSIWFLLILLCFTQVRAFGEVPLAQPSRVVTAYALTAEDPALAPAAWTFLGSSDGKSWKELDKRKGEKFEPRERRLFFIENRDAYRIYRLQIEANAAGAPQGTSLAELEFNGPVVGSGREPIFQALITSSREHPLRGSAWNAFDREATSRWVDLGQFENGGCWIQCEYVNHSEALITNVNQLKVFNRLMVPRMILAEKAPEIQLRLAAAMLKPPRALTGYAITSANDDPARDPRDWRLLGSNDDGKTWATLDTRQNEVFTTRFQRRVFMLQKPASYLFYRLQIDVAGKPTGAYATQLAEVEPLYSAPKPEERFSLIVSADSDNSPMERTAMAFDGDSSSKWLAFHAPASAAHWIQWQSVPEVKGLPLIDLGQLNRARSENPESSPQAGRLARTLASYSLVSADDTPARDPMDWRVLGSNDDGLTWETLDVRHHELFNQRLERRTFSVRKPAPYALIRLQIDSVRDPSDAVQLANLVPDYAPDPAANSLSTKVWAEGDHPPNEGVEHLFEITSKNKWLHFSKNPNCASWIQWCFIAGDKRPVIRADSGPPAQLGMPRAIKLQAEGVAIAVDGGSLYFLDETGFQFFKLEQPIEGLNTGQRIRLRGQIQFEGDQPRIVNAEATPMAALAEVPLILSAEPYSESLSAGSAEGKVTAVSNGAVYSTLQLELSDKHRLSVRILNPKSGARPVYGNCRLRVRGIVEPAFNKEGTRVPGIIWVAGLDDVSLCPPPERWNQWREYPSQDSSEKVEEGELVRIVGTVRQQDAQERLIVDVGPTPFIIHTSEMFPPGSIVEGAGFLIKEGSALTLHPGCARLVVERKRPAPPPLIFDENHPVTEIRQIYEVARNQPDKPFYVKVRGVITYIDLGLSEWHLQDGADSIVVQDQLASGVSPFLQQEGMYVEVQGRVWSRRWPGIAPTAFASVLGRGQMPEPIRHPWEHLMTGRDEGRWVQLDGIVTAFEKQRLTLNVSGGQVVAWVNEIDPSVQKRLLGSIVRVSGVCSAVRNGRGQQLGVRLLIPSAEYVEVVKASPEDPFDVPMLPVESIMRVQATNVGFTIQLVKTAGIVTHKNMRQLFVQDGAAAVRVVIRDDSTVQPGDKVEVVGLAQADGLSPKLVQAWIRKTGESALPPTHPVNVHEIDSTDAQTSQDSTRASINATFRGKSANDFVQILELEDEKEKKPFYAYLPLQSDPAFELPSGSRVRLTGVFKAKTDMVPDFGQVVTSFEMYLNSPADILVVQRPPWWTARHTLWTVSALGSILLGALAWAALLRKQVRGRTRELDAEILEHKQTESELQTQIAEGKQMEIEIEKTHRQLLDASRQAGMAEIASNVLHNVGNVLNSVNISCSVISSTVRKSNISSFAKITDLLRKNSADLSAFFTLDPAGQKLPDFFGKLALRLENEQTTVLGEIDSLGRNIEHIKAIVAFQQNYAKGLRVGECVALADVVEHALKINAESLTIERVEVLRDFLDVPPVTMERHKVLQILVNLLQNATHALADSKADPRQIFVCIAGGDDRVSVSVRDNGVGIPSENLIRIFAHGFTTKKEGHGFGLHSGVVAAGEMGGRLTALSDGTDKGATFTLELPIHFESVVSRLWQE